MSARDAVEARMRSKLPPLPEPEPEDEASRNLDAAFEVIREDIADHEDEPE